MGKYMERVFTKNSPKPNAASRNNASWYTDTDEFLEYSPSGGSLYYKEPDLQKIFPLFEGPPLIYDVWGNNKTLISLRTHFRKILEE